MKSGRYMLYLTVKAALSGVIIAIVSGVARRSPALGALIVSLPLLSILGILWLWHDTSDVERIAAHAQWTFCHDIDFWTTLATCCALTFVLYLGTIWLLARFGVPL